MSGKNKSIRAKGLQGDKKIKSCKSASFLQDTCVSLRLLASLGFDGKE